MMYCLLCFSFKANGHKSLVEVGSGWWRDSLISFVSYVGESLIYCFFICHNKGNYDYKTSAPFGESFHARTKIWKYIYQKC